MGSHECHTCDISKQRPQKDPGQTPALFSNRFVSLGLKFLFLVGQALSSALAGYGSSSFNWGISCPSPFTSTPHPFPAVPP